MTVISSNVATALKRHHKTRPLVATRMARMLQRGAAQIIDLSEEDDIARESCDCSHDFSGKRLCERSELKLPSKPAFFQGK